MSVNNEKKEIPLIKETRLDKLSAALKCINTFHYDREKQRDCILKEYPGKSEKSAFRGLIIPSLRHLGLILGTGKDISVSANGMLILQGKTQTREDYFRIVRAIILELDIQQMGFLKKMSKLKEIEEIEFTQELLSEIDSFSEKQSLERIKQWIKLLRECKLIVKEKKTLHININATKLAEKDLNTSQKIKYFEAILIQSYKKMVTDDLGIIKISKLREDVSKTMYSENNEIITECQFDMLLSQIPHVTDSYIISFGEPIGSDEKLFKFNDRYYKTLNIRFCNRG